jgi:PAS domain S-box-containing protein
VEERLRLSSAELSKLYAAVEQSPSSVVITDAQGRIEYVNRAFTELTGYSAEEAIGQNPRILKSGDTPKETYQELWETITKGKIWRGIFHNRRKDGGHTWESVSIAPVRASEGTTITHFIAVKEDITARREVEAQLHQAQKMEAIGQLAAGIAHEINTPTQFVSDNLFFLQGAFGDLLGLMASYRRMVDRVATDPAYAPLVAETRQAEVTADIAYVTDNAPTAFESSLDGIKRISKIVRAMKEFSHPDQREMAPANLNAALENTLTIARNEYKYVADVEREFADLAPVVCHVGDLCQVFLNLLVNAAHAIDDVMRRTGKRGIIKVRTIAEEGYARIEIEDSGTGIPESARPHVFDPFFTTKEVGKGTGQGLAIAHGIVVTRHKGTLSFQTEMGKGTTFILRLPYAEAASSANGDGGG